MLQMTVFSGHLSCLSSTVLGVWLISRYTGFDSSGQDLCPHRIMVVRLPCKQFMMVQVRLWALNILTKVCGEYVGRNDEEIGDKNNVAITTRKPILAEN